MILLGILSGEVYTTSNDIGSLAVRNPYGITDLRREKQSKEIIRDLRKVERELFSDPEFAKRISASMEIYNALQNEYVNFPHWYLTLIAIDPLYQGKGYASILIRAKLMELDKQKLPCYLNTQNKENVPIYEHFGFELVGKIQLPNSNINYYGMLRKNKK